MMSKNSKESIVFVHGLWVGRWIWVAFRRFFKAKGYMTYSFGYSTTNQPVEKSTMQLAAFVNSRPEQTVHLVAHSMGGIVSVRSLSKINKPGKLVLLGSPINGSSVAHRIKQRGWHKWMLRHATEPLGNGVIEAPGHGRKTMMIAGNAPYGLGRLIGGSSGDNDGTVDVNETVADWVDHHVQINCSHTGMLRNKQAMQMTWDFMKQEAP